MSESSKSETLELFARHVREQKNVLVKYEVSGGPPGERISNKMIIGEGGGVKVEVNDEMEAVTESRDLSVSKEEQRLILEELVRSLDIDKTLLVKSDNIFLPDSVISSLTI